MITNLPPPGGVSPVHHHHHYHPHPQGSAGVPPSDPSATSSTTTQDSFSHFEEDFQQAPPPTSTATGYPPQSYQYYPHQYPHQPQQQYPPQQAPNWHHQHGYYNVYPSSQQQTYPNYSPSDPYNNYPGPNGYSYPEQTQQHNNAQQPSAQNCTPSPLANSDDSGGDCVNESKAGSLRGGIIPLIPRPKGPRPTTSVMSAKRGGKRARQRDPNEPQKPVSAYALFFRDVQAGIKARNPAASFGEVSKHVAALWDGMDPDSKGAYKRRTEQAKKEYLRQLAAYRATLVSKGNTLESPYNGKGLDVTKVGEDSRSYLMNPRMSESSGYGSNSSGNSLTPLGSAPTSTSPQSALGQSPNNGYHLSQHHAHLRQHPAHMQQQPSHQSDVRSYNNGYDPYSQHPDHDPMNSAPSSLMSNCKRPGCPNPVRMSSTSTRMPEYCSNDCLVDDKQMTSNPYANATTNWPPPTSQPEDSSSPNTTAAAPPAEDK